ncbi:MAG: transcriptional regulator [Sphaerospermopsis sp.]|jgi:DNA-binding phage protein|uniref:helix-turn-helix domain-containing transcriptional regulator n=1 Tax=Sphaerospermopsis sp. LEGE 00249 TaxID=1380707 RepID=UPI00164EC906|nr:transcriptional regulator [Sphaerospermopsis sp. LEGE 00249]MBC5797274.1 transcriptional regulator [Sphaerospermopsis sp. LEGE 00249]MEB3148415.1 transcriptional regulator [Sphaerospermopsis sp.]
MKNVKIPTSRNYQEFLIESLKNSEEAASYLEIVLEEGSDEPLLLQNAISNVVEAYAKMNHISDSTKQQYEKLQNILKQSNCAEIYAFLELLNTIGFQISITPKSNSPYQS